MNCPDPVSCRAQPKRSEQGYILITAMWLLLLGGSIVALLMLRNLHAAEAYSDDRPQLQLRYAQESAVETVVADILFNGPRSEFARLPAKAGRWMSIRRMPP